MATLNTTAVKNRNRLPSLFKTKESGIIASFIVICLIIGIKNPVFFGIENVLNVLRSASFTFIIGIGMTYILIAAGLDLSVGSVLGLGGVVGAMASVSGIPVPLAIVIGLLLGAIVGYINGLLIVRVNIPSLIVTLGMLYGARGVIMVITQGAPVYPLPHDFTWIGQARLAGVPIPIYIALILGFVGHYVLSHTTYGRAVYAVGGNKETARLAGINVNRVQISVYVITAIFAALVGMMMAARLSSAQAGAGEGFELQVIAAVIIGGTSMFGGAGTIIGTLFGALIMSVLNNGMVLLKINPFYQSVVIGGIIILAVWIDQVRRKRALK